jgi:hypothetical protein
LYIARYHLSLQTVIVLLSVNPQPTIGQASLAVETMAESSTTSVAIILVQTMAGVILLTGGLAPQVVNQTVERRVLGEVVSLAQDIVTV